MSCCNGLVVGTVAHDIRIAHKGRVQDEVIEGAFRVLDDFKAVDASIDAMKSLDLQPEEEQAFATAAHTLRYGERTPDQPPRTDHGESADPGPACRRHRRQPVAEPEPDPVERHAGWSDRPQCPGPALAHPGGGQY